MSSSCTFKIFEVFRFEYSASFDYHCCAFESQFLLLCLHGENGFNVAGSFIPVNKEVHAAIIDFFFKITEANFISHNNCTIS